MLLLRVFEVRLSDSGAGGGGAEDPGLGLEESEAAGEIQDESWYKLEAAEAGYSVFDDNEELGYLGEALLWGWVARQLSIDDGRWPALLKASWLSRFSWDDEDTGADSNLRLLRSSWGPGGRLTEYCW